MKEIYFGEYHLMHDLANEMKARGYKYIAFQDPDEREFTQREKIDFVSVLMHYDTGLKGGRVRFFATETSPRQESETFRFYDEYRVFRQVGIWRPSRKCLKTSENRA